MPLASLHRGRIRRNVVGVGDRSPAGQAGRGALGRRSSLLVHQPRRQGSMFSVLSPCPKAPPRYDPTRSPSQGRLPRTVDSVSERFAGHDTAAAQEVIAMRAENARLLRLVKLTPGPGRTAQSRPGRVLRGAAGACQCGLACRGQGGVVRCSVRRPDGCARAPVEERAHREGRLAAGGPRASPPAPARRCRRT
jgi:hypothetical protein